MVEGWKNTGLLAVVFHTKVSMQKEAMGEGRVRRAVSISAMILMLNVMMRDLKKKSGR